MKEYSIKHISNVLKSNSVIFTLSSFSSKVVSIFLVPIYTRNLDIADYGLFDLMLIVLTFLQILFTLEISQGMARYIPIMKGESSKSILISSALGVILALCLLLIILLSAVSLFFKSIFSNELKPYILLYFILSILHLYLKNNLRWLLKAREYFIQVLIFSLSSLILTYYWLVEKNLGLKGVYLALNCATLISILYCLVIQIKYISISISKRYIQLLLKFSMPLIISSLSIVLGSFVDRIYISSKLGLEDLAIYSLGHRIASISGFVVFGLASAYLPIIYKNPYGQKMKILFEQLFIYILCVAFFLSVLLTFYHSEIIILLSDSKYLDAGKVAIILGISVILGNSIFLFPGLYIENKTSLLAKLNLFLVLCNLALNWLAIIFFNTIISVSIATLVSQLIFFIMNIYISQKYYDKSFMRIQQYWFQVLLLLIVLLIPFTSINPVQINLIFRIIFSIIICFLFYYSLKSKLKLIKV